MKKKLKKPQQTKIISIILVLAFAFVGSYILISSEAATANATLTLTPSSGSYEIGKNFTVSLYENSGTQKTYGVNIELNYDANKLELVAKDHTGVALNRCIDETAAVGKIVFGCSNYDQGFTGLTGSQKIANLTFKPKIGTGSTSVQFGSGSAIYFQETNANGEQVQENIWNQVAAGATYNLTTPDTTPPSVSLTSPLNGVIVSGSAVALQANASDDSGTVSKVEFMVNGAVVNTDTQSPFSYTWDSNSLTDRTGLSIQAVAYDNATPTPNKATASITVTVKNNKPNLEVSSLTISPTDPKAGEEVTVTAQIKNSGSDNITASISNIFKLNSSNLNSAVTIAGLNAGATKTITTTWTATRGSHTILAIVDQNSTITESNESDNQKSLSFVVYKPGDTNDDGLVNGSDLSTLAFNYGKTGMTLAQGDLSGDGKINGADLSILSYNWMK